MTDKRVEGLVEKPTKTTCDDKKSALARLLNIALLKNDPVFALGVLRNVGEGGRTSLLSEEEIHPLYLRVLSLAVGGDLKKLSRLILGKPV